MPRAQATPDARGLVAVRFAGGLALLGLAALAFWAAEYFLPAQVDEAFPWSVERLVPLLRLSGGWFLFLGIVVVVTSKTARRGSIHFPRIQLTERHGAILLAGLIAVFALAYSWMAVTKHLRFNSTGYDLAIGTQAIWNTAHGHPFATSLEVDNRLADHFAPSLLLIVPIYAVFPSPMTLLILQALLVGLGAIPIYRMAKRRLASVTLALIPAAVYALFPATGYLLRFDFHLEFLAVLAFLAAFDAMDEGRWKLATLWLVIALGCKEDMGLTVAAFGLYALTVRRKATWGTAWLLIGVATFVLASFWLIPLFRGESSDTLTRYRWLGSSPGEMLRTLLTNPGKVWDHVSHPRQLLYAIQMLLPVGYLALLAPLALLLAAPAILLNLLSDSWPQSTIYFQYTAAIIPVVFIAAVQGISHLKRVLGAAWSQTVVTFALLPLSLAVFLLTNPFQEIEPLPSIWVSPDNAQAVSLGLQIVPPDASVVTTNHYAPHLAHRRKLYVIGPVSQRKPPSDPDAVFFNLRDYRFASHNGYRDYLLRLDPQRYGVTFDSDGVVVIERDKGSPEAFKELLANWPPSE